MDLCHDCLVAQGVLRHVQRLGWLYEDEARDGAVVRTAWGRARKLVERREREDMGLGDAEDGGGGGPQGRALPRTDTAGGVRPCLVWLPQESYWGLAAPRTLHCEDN